MRRSCCSHKTALARPSRARARWGKDKYMNNSTRAVALMISMSLCGFGVLGMLPVQAQEQSGGGLQEVVVTATRHEEALSRVPISVTALTQDAMEARGIKDFQDIARFTPGVSIDNST